MADSDEFKRPRRREDDDRDFEDDDDRPTRRRKKPRDLDDDFDDDRDETDGTGGLIPYKNPKALAAYYCGVFGLASCVLGLGIFGIVPIVLGFLGLSYAKQHPQASGKAHAWVGILLGLFEVLFFFTTIIAIIYVVSTK